MMAFGKARFSHLNLAVGAKTLLHFLQEGVLCRSRWQCCSSAVFLEAAWPVPGLSID